MTNMPANIIERKVKTDGSWHEYSCGVVSMTPGLLVISYVMARGGTLPDVHLPVAPGSISYGYFWRDRPYSLYRMKRPDGSIIAHRFDAVGDVRWTDTLLEYRDLVLDWWLLADGTLLTEDEDELAELVQRNAITADDVAIAEAARTAITCGWPGVVAELEAFEAGANIGGQPGTQSLHPPQESS
jgi:hypothetical protein